MPEDETGIGESEPPGHRPWPLPARPWSWRQTWHDLLFMHWPVPVASVRSLVPEPLTIDRHHGSAWVAVIPFWMSGVTLRGWPALPGISRFPELNVRTYVVLHDRPGVWFFSLDAARRLPVWTARWLFHLPYVHARMRVAYGRAPTREGEGGGPRIVYRSQRPQGPGFVAEYGPAGPPEHAAPGTLAHFLTERYCLYASGPRGLCRAEIHHAPWPLRPATAAVTRNDMLAAHGIPVDGDPLLHYARRLEVRVWSLEAA